MQSLYYRLLYPFYHSPSTRAEREYIERACDRLYTLHPDVGQSALSQNKLERSFQYDLQIIVPAYNVESYIAECIDSILAQRTSFRILVTVVNDGSTDQTFSVLQRYADCPEICIIQQENKGFSGARNAALKHIRASYIMFVDADDKLPEGAVESLMRSALRTDADIVEGGYSRFVGERTTFTFRHSESFTRDWSILYGFPVGKVYKSWLFEDVVFPLGYWFEDTICIYPLSALQGCSYHTGRCLFVSAERTRYHFYFPGEYQDVGRSMGDPPFIGRQQADGNSCYTGFVRHVVVGFKREPDPFCDLG